MKIEKWFQTEAEHVIEFCIYFSINEKKGYLSFIMYENFFTCTFDYDEKNIDQYPFTTRFDASGIEEAKKKAEAFAIGILLNQIKELTILAEEFNLFSS